jgi:hypothetical protein
MLNRIALGVSLIIVLTLAGSAFAGNNAGPRKASSSINLLLMGQAGAAALATPHWGDTVTFDVSTTATTQPSVVARCFQDGAQVYAHYGFFYGDWSPSRNFILQSYGWTGGAADCTATLYYMNPQKGTEVDLATLPFHVDA